MSRLDRGRAMQLGFQIARQQAQQWMRSEAQQLRSAIASDIAELHRELNEARAELAEARREIARLNAIKRIAWPETSSLH
jgi:hypothetical protein